MFCLDVPSSARWWRSICTARRPGLSQLRKDGELSSPWDLLEDMAAMAPNVHSNSHRHHGELPGFQEQLICSVLASSTAGPWLSSPPASIRVLLGQLNAWGRASRTAPVGVRVRISLGSITSLYADSTCAKQLCKGSQKDQPAPATRFWPSLLLWMSSPAAGPSLAQPGAAPHGPDQPSRQGPAGKTRSQL